MPSSRLFDFRYSLTCMTGCIGRVWVEFSCCCVCMLCFLQYLEFEFYRVLGEHAGAVAPVLLVWEPL